MRERRREEEEEVSFNPPMYAKHYQSGYKIPHLFSDKKEEEEQGEREEEMVYLYI